MEQLKSDQIVSDLKNNIIHLQEVIRQQENLLIELLTELDKINNNFENKEE